MIQEKDKNIVELNKLIDIRKKELSDAKGIIADMAGKQVREV